MGHPARITMCIVCIKFLGAPLIGGLPVKEFYVGLSPTLGANFYWAGSINGNAHPKTIGFGGE